MGRERGTALRGLRGGDELTSWQMHKQCENCPWRRDAPPGEFTLERFEALRCSVEQGFGRLFACHKTPEEDKRACVGYVMNQLREGGRGPQNFNLRKLLSSGLIDPDQMTLVGPQYDNYDEMVEANRLAEKKRKRVRSQDHRKGHRKAGARNKPP
jgi:hypothetical protein